MPAESIRTAPRQSPPPPAKDSNKAIEPKSEDRKERERDEVVWEWEID